jgi:LmbE family N-acetylglucosaminyl deacetylase
VDVRVSEFRDAFFPHDEGIKEFFESLKRDVAPDLVLTHTRHDLHQDHRIVCELAWNTFRDHLVLEYEVPKYDGDLGAPNVFMPLEERHVHRKAELLLEHFGTQRDKHWFTEDLFRSLARIRGMECRSPTGYAEAFYGRKLRLGIG